RSEDVARLKPWARLWQRWVSATFLRSYLELSSRVPFLPEEPREMKLLLDIFLLEKAIYELGYELNNRPTWVEIPMQGILDLMEPGNA
ncbi:MAG TPA: hypothetical protein VNL15_08355, partial [Dehalococcoidia bacterium]|nr:hypothetical protein [Dehalococcoidia bacterium]